MDRSTIQKVTAQLERLTAVHRREETIDESGEVDEKEEEDTKKVRKEK